MQAVFTKFDFEAAEPHEVGNKKCGWYMDDFRISQYFPKYVESIIFSDLDRFKLENCDRRGFAGPKPFRSNIFLRFFNHNNVSYLCVKLGTSFT